MQSQAFHPTNFEKMSVERGIAFDLLGEHTPLEIEGILTSLCDDSEKASAILNDVPSID